MELNRIHSQKLQSYNSNLKVIIRVISQSLTQIILPREYFSYRLQFVGRRMYLLVHSVRKLVFIRSNHQRCSIKKAILKNSKYSQENNCVGISFNKVAGLRSLQLYQKETATQVIFVNIANFLRSTSLKNICERLLLVRMKRGRMIRNSRQVDLVRYHDWLPILTQT